MRNLTSVFCKTDHIASGQPVLLDKNCCFTQDNLKGASKDEHNQCHSHMEKFF